MVIAFCVASAFFIYISRRPLCSGESHGFYRFFAWEFMLALFLLNVSHWYENPVSAFQLVSWLLLAISVCFVSYGLYLLKVIGKPTQARQDKDLYPFERTSSLVTVGIYKYIRHPLYSSLFFLTWGIFFKDPSWVGLLLSVAASVFLYQAGKHEEVECLAYFGDDYCHYMQGTKRFVPFLF